MSEYLINIGKRAKKAAAKLSDLSEKEKNDILIKAAEGLKKDSAKIIAANKKDYDKAKEAGMSEGLLDRLVLDEGRISLMAQGLCDLAALKSSLGEILDTYTREDGLVIEKVRVPMGVIGIIYESRPNVTSDAFGITFKMGNACILRGGSDAVNSMIAIADSIRNTLSEAGVDQNTIQVIDNTDREIVNEFMKLKSYVDLLIPRGGAGLINNVVNNATIPVIETGTGNCHIYLHEDADLDMAIPIIINAKTQRLGVCNAAESLVIHSAILKKALPAIKDALFAADVEIRGDKRAKEVCPDINEATEEDFYKEYLARIISVKTVDSLEEAIEHINHYGTHHSDSIITKDKTAADKFLKEVDSACVYHNASTRFTDGFEFGLGAEIGISTQKLHARGPMGLNEMTTYKYLIHGNGNIRK
ncbi:MAG: glutamate-5-semialdehyde dehydrogenase [Lachnospiraceae bacterium]|nr:glutamate-5-semialdehyde dehydrogenase [Lachnospiraceae bacterium]